MADRTLSSPARLLHILRESPKAFPLTATTYEEETGAALETLLSRTGLKAGQTNERTAAAPHPLAADELGRFRPAADEHPAGRAGTALWSKKTLTWKSPEPGSRYHTPDCDLHVA